MQSNAGLKLISQCAYLTSRDNPWRDVDHISSKMVKALKGDPIVGYFNYIIAGQHRRFDQSNVAEFVDRIPRAMARMIRRHWDGRATLVPIPNSHVVDPNTPDFKTFELARKISAHSGGRLTVEPALVFQEPQIKARQGGPRSADEMEAALRVVADVSSPIILIDDVCTLGGHLVGAHRKLHRPPVSSIVLACVFGRSTKQQHENPIGVREEQISVE